MRHNTSDKLTAMSMQEQAALAVKRSYSYAQTNQAPDAGDEMGGDLEIGIIARRTLPQQTFLRLMRSSNNAGCYVAVTTTKLENRGTKIHPASQAGVSLLS